MNVRRWLRCVATLGLVLNVAAAYAAESSYQDLVSLFQRWRTFEVPERLDGAAGLHGRSDAAQSAKGCGKFRLSSPRWT